MNNRLWNVKNPNQGEYKKVLCVCSAGLLRSPTAAVVLASEPFNYNTRAVGVDAGHALLPIDEVLLDWADEIVCMHPAITHTLRAFFDSDILNGLEIITLNIPDRYPYRDPNLMKMIGVQYSNYLGEKEAAKSGKIVT
jgi:predicted protein tyrosine phosphatase